MKDKSITIPTGLEIPEGETVFTAVVEFDVVDGTLVPKSIDGIELAVEDVADEAPAEMPMEEPVSTGDAIAGRVAELV